MTKTPKEAIAAALAEFEASRHQRRISAEIAKPVVIQITEDQIAEIEGRAAKTLSAAHSIWITSEELSLLASAARLGIAAGAADVGALREGLCGWPDCGCEGDEACRLAQHVLMEEKRASSATARAELAEAEIERLREALRGIDDLCPVTQEVTTAHMMADIATAALQPRTPSQDRTDADLRAAVAAEREACAACAESFKVNLDDGRRAQDQLAEVIRSRAALSQTPASAEGWRPIETAPKGKKVLVGWRNPQGKWFTVTARFFEDGELEDEEGDPCRAGWYEESETHETLLLLGRGQTPTHWMPLPADPEARS